MTPTPTEQVRSPQLLRRLLAVVFGLALVGGLTTACSSDDSDDNSASSSATDDSYYPHTMKTPHGDVTIKKKPERILALNVAVADHLITLGITPAKVGTDPKSLDNTPWIKDNIKKISEGGLYSSGEFNVEKIANFDPDLIVGMPYQFQNEENFKKLNTIAPTVFQNSLDTTAEWKASFLATAESVNKVDTANDIIKRNEEAFREVGSRVDGISSMTYTFGGPNSEGTGFGYGDGRIFEMFGMKPSDNQDNANQTKVPLENIAQLDSDLLVIYSTTSEQLSKIESNPGYKSLSSVKNGNVIVVGTPEAMVINTTSPGGLSWILEKLAPSIEALGR
ncbi:ABC transporter substrate-binding protein [Corynebacterium neomassiliense]|uniref:ABC transporter substrate-binding protein n=1 Tax=Corynebacterium neomassiliense TaxID=2079482 RepID=UPI0010318D4F|nr:ABC transporter substrate-binding protein [Corynebacterium neomassiliense]